MNQNIVNNKFITQQGNNNLLIIKLLKIFLKKMHKMFEV